MSDILREMGRLARRFPKDVTTAALFQELLSGKRTLWLVLKDEKFTAMAMTTVRVIDATGTRVFTLCDLAGKNIFEFDDLLCETLEAAAGDCEIAIEAGRAGWEWFAKKHGYRKHAVLYRKSR
ncbi:MAG: hypothetical protein E5X05_01300 [Mesorhizobium sp.]|nr:MAG: hypothetical protein E5X05_01300 [Mesorhizobium sp.]